MSADSRAADPFGRRRACVADYHAPHCFGRLVDGRAGQRTELTLRSVFRRGSRSLAGVGDTVRRLRGMATAVDRGRDSATAGRLLENHAGWSAGVARVANGSCATGAAELWRRYAAGGLGGGVDVRVGGG